MTIKVTHLSPITKRARLNHKSFTQEFQNESAYSNDNISMLNQVLEDVQQEEEEMAPDKKEDDDYKSGSIDNLRPARASPPKRNVPRIEMLELEIKKKVAHDKEVVGLLEKLES